MGYFTDVCTSRGQSLPPTLQARSKLFLSGTATAKGSA